MSPDRRRLHRQCSSPMLRGIGPRPRTLCGSVPRDRGRVRRGPHRNGAVWRTVDPSQQDFGPHRPERAVRQCFDVLTVRESIDSKAGRNPGLPALRGVFDRILRRDPQGVRATAALPGQESAGLDQFRSHSSDCHVVVIGPRGSPRSSCKSHALRTPRTKESGSTENWVMVRRDGWARATGWTQRLPSPSHGNGRRTHPAEAESTTLVHPPPDKAVA